MNDIEEIYQCLLEKTYQDAVKLDIVLSKVEDEDLKLGFLVDLVARHKEYEADEETVQLAIANTFDTEKLNYEHVTICHEIYISTLKKKNEESLIENKFSITTLMLLLEEKIDEYEYEVSRCESKGALAKLKDQLIEAEIYESIAVIDKRLSQIEQ